MVADAQQSETGRTIIGFVIQLPIPVPLSDCDALVIQLHDGNNSRIIAEGRITKPLNEYSGVLPVS